MYLYIDMYAVVSGYFLCSLFIIPSLLHHNLLHHKLIYTGGEIVSTFDNPDSVKLGHCKVIEEIMIGEDRMVHFQGCALNEACTIVLRGASMWGLVMDVCRNGW